MTERAIECELVLPDDPLATERLGELVGARLGAGDTVALTGDLGAGKTTFVRGLGRGLQVDDPDAVCSPTYLLVIEHDGETPLRHADAYLPEKLEAFLHDGGLEYLFANDCVVAVEWADRVRNLLPDSVLWVALRDGAEPGRRVHLRGTGPGDYSWLPKLAGSM